MTRDPVFGGGGGDVVGATGANWRRDGTGSFHMRPIPIAAEPEVLTPDDLMAGKRPKGRTVAIFDDDHYYMGGVLAELLRKEDYGVRLITPAALVSTYTKWT